MKSYVGAATVYVSDPDRAKAFFMEKFGWACVMDVPMGEDYRWITVGPSGDRDAEQTEIVLAKESTEEWSGKAGVRTNLIIECENVAEMVKSLKEKGVEITDGPKNESWGGWAMFKDSEGNEYGLHSDPRNS